MPRSGSSPAEPDLFDRHMAAIFATLADGWPRTTEGEIFVAALIGHAMAFETWRSLTGSGLSNDQARDLLVSIVSGVANGTLGVEAS